MIKITKDSHVDHGLTEAMKAHILERFVDRNGFFIETFELPEELGTLEVSLIGPATGGAPIAEDQVGYMVRKDRKWASRVHKDGSAFQALDARFDEQLGRYIFERPFPTKPQSRLVTVVAGPHDGETCVLYTAYGGPQAPREPGDPAIKSWDELVASREFWAQHALVW